MDYDYNGLVQDIASTRAFQRIRGVSFLGIVDHVNISRHSRRAFFSRGEHSLGVLKLGLIVSRELSLDKADTSHLLATCLVHDLGHPPFSHSLEYAFSAKGRKWNHHSVLEDLLLSPSGSDRALVRVLLKYDISPDRISRIVNNKDPLSFFFNCPLNIDTLDGISRSLWSLGFVPTFDVELITACTARLYAGSRTSDRQFLKHADTFWVSKGTFYRFLESDSEIATAERQFQRSVRERVGELRRNIFVLTDKQFAAQFPDVIRDTTTADTLEIDQKSHQEFVVDQSVRTVDMHNLRYRYIRLRNEQRRSSEFAS